MEKDNILKKLIQSLEVLILKFKFEEAAKLLVNFDELTITSAIQTMGFDKPGVLAYVFVCFLLKNEEKAIYHYAASLLMSNAFNHYPEGHLAGYYHARRALELDPRNIHYKEYLLEFRVIPEQILSKEVAIQLAKEVIKAKPNSYRAKEILGLE